jgi:hypothetical protein
MMRKSELEKAIRSLQTDAQKLGLKITECLVLIPKVVVELEKCESRFYGIVKKKPIFVSKKNYNDRVTGDFDDCEYGRIFEIRLINNGGMKMVKEEKLINSLFTLLGEPCGKLIHECKNQKAHQLYSDWKIKK